MEKHDEHPHRPGGQMPLLVTGAPALRRAIELMSQPTPADELVDALLDPGDGEDLIRRGH